MELVYEMSKEYFVRKVEEFEKFTKEIDLNGLDEENRVRVDRVMVLIKDVNLELKKSAKEFIIGLIWMTIDSINVCINNIKE